MRNDRLQDSFAGPDRVFPATSWGLVSGLRAAAEPRRRAALEKLCRRYWKPVACYLRGGWRESDQDAKDLAQEFFLWLSEVEVLARYAPEQAGFRAYLKGLLRNFMRDRIKERGRVKRGGRAALASIDSAGPISDGTDPDAAFDRLWKQELMDRAVRRARRAFGGDRAIQFRAFEEHDLAGAPSYAAVAGKLEIPESRVRDYLFTVREQVRSELRAELAETVADAAELEAEWRSLFGA